MGDDAETAEIFGGPWTIPTMENAGAVPVLEADPPKRPNDFIIIPGAPRREGVNAPSSAPWKGVVLMKFTFRGNLIRVGTGFFIDRHVLLTVRHNLDPANFDQAGFWPGLDAQSNPAARPLTIKANARHDRLDLAVLITEEAADWHFTANAAPPAPPAKATLAGYAMPYPDGTPQLTQASGEVAYGGGDLLAYRINTRPGDSGAPVFDAGGGVALGIHSDPPLGSATMNAGIRFTAGVVAEIHRLTVLAQSHA
ncbi:trypsin-like serine peptidase [Sphingomonas sp. RIT328]|uniref:trypsin-like serine peptidase n=1 Tax=Sphingomonas sp. RIT328 TaxID=1470591 RepID=UPI00044BAABB|nr:serine protease [Sphingomonas sp. RIT328]EZP50004.1 V8-like Glu-specific endopeptidase [Sphingomonas sp. RIT328]